MRKGKAWGPDDVRDLRRKLGITQQALAETLGVRQQTVSEWETGLYRPRGASVRVLDFVAERADLDYAPNSATALGSGLMVESTGDVTPDSAVARPEFRDEYEGDHDPADGS